MVLLLLAFIFLPIAAIFLFERRKRFKDGIFPPSPPGLPIIGNLHQFETSNTHMYLSNLAKKHGPLMSMKLGSVHVVVASSAKMAKEVLKAHDLACCSRPALTGTHKLSYGGLDVAFAPYDESWRELRKIYVVHLMSNKQVQSLRPVREDEVSRMIKNVKSSGESGSIINLSEIMMSLTSSLILTTAFGKKMEEAESRKGQLDKLMIEAQAMQGGFFLSDFLPWLGWVDHLSGMMGRLERTFKTFDRFFQEMIDEHLNSDGKNTKSPNFLDMLIQLKTQNSCSINLTWDQVKALILDIFVAGTDTSAAATVWAMTALIKNPDAMRKLQTEIREKVGKKGFVHEDDMPNLPYLKAVVKETFRLFPPAPLLIPRETMQKCIIQGYTIQAKTLVYVNAWAIARDPEYWENPNEFLPERFLNSCIDIIGNNFEVIPFGAGRRGCTGISIGLATVELALANLLHSFDWELPVGIRKEEIDTECLPGITMHKKNPLYLVPRAYSCE